MVFARSLAEPGTDRRKPRIGLAPIEIWVAECSPVKGASVLNTNVKLDQREARFAAPARIFRVGDDVAMPHSRCYKERSGARARG